MRAAEVKTLMDLQTWLSTNRLRLTLISPGDSKGGYIASLYDMKGETVGIGRGDTVLECLQDSMSAAEKGI